MFSNHNRFVLPLLPASCFLLPRLLPPPDFDRTVHGLYRDSTVAAPKHGARPQEAPRRAVAVDPVGEWFTIQVPVALDADLRLMCPGVRGLQVQTSVEVARKFDDDPAIPGRRFHDLLS